MTTPSPTAQVPEPSQEEKEAANEMRRRYVSDQKGDGTYTLELSRALTNLFFDELKDIIQSAITRACASRDATIARLTEERDRGLYKGNSYEYWYTKAKCYGDMVHGCSPALEAAGFPVDHYAKDGAVGAIARSVTALADTLAQLRAELARKDEETSELKHKSKP